MARNPIHDILSEPSAPAAEPAVRKNPIYDIIPVEKIDIPKDIIRFGGGTGSEERFRQLSPPVQRELIASAQEYYKKTGKPLQVNSGFRTPEDQERLYNESVKAGRPGVGPTGMPIAKPNESKHQYGIVVDIQQGKDDPVAKEILGKRGFTQSVPNDPVHFEYRQPQTAQLASPVATSALPLSAQQNPELVSEAPTETQEPSIAPRPKKSFGQAAGETAQAGAVGLGMGATAGLMQYPAAGVLALATRLAPQGAPLSLKDALAQVRETTGEIRETSPIAYGAGEIGGTIAGVGKLGAVGKVGQARGVAQTAASLARPAAVAAGYGATQKYTESPETTLGEAAKTGALAGAGTVAFGGAGKLVEKGFSKVGQSATKAYIEKMIESHVPGTKSALEKTFGPAYRTAVEKAQATKPTLESIKAQFEAEGTRAGTAKVMMRYKESLAKWENQNKHLKDITSWAQRRAENPELVQRYASQAAPNSPYSLEVKEAAERLTGAAKAAMGGQAVATGLTTLGGASGIGALGGGLYNYYTGGDPLMGAITGGGALPLALAAGKFGGMQQYLTQSGLPSAAASLAGSQGYRIGDLTGRKPE